MLPRPHPCMLNFTKEGLESRLLFQNNFALLTLEALLSDYVLETRSFKLSGMGGQVSILLEHLIHLMISCNVRRYISICKDPVQINSKSTLPQLYSNVGSTSYLSGSPTNGASRVHLQYPYLLIKTRKL